jgi:hypothetical protein
MRCDHCKKKGMICIPCADCDRKSLCTGCIQLENHECTGILNKIQSQLDNIKKLNPKIVSEKIQRL